MSVMDEALRILNESEGERTAVDGDTLYEPGNDTSVRVRNMDAPETFKVTDDGVQPNQLGSEVAREALQLLINEPGVTVDRDGKDVYDRDLATVTNENGKDVGLQMIESGFADGGRSPNSETAAAEFTNFSRSATPSGLMFEDPSIRALRKKLEVEKLANPTTFDLGDTRQQIGGSSNFGNALSRGTDTLQASLYGAASALAEATGFDAIAEWGEEGFRQELLEAAANPAKIESIDDVDSLGSFVTYAVETLGEQAPNLAFMLAGRGAGSATARAAVGKSLINKAASKHFANAGTFIPSTALGIGEVQMELKMNGIDAPEDAIIAGLAIGGLDAISFNFMLGHYFSSVTKKQASNFITHVAKGFGMGAARGVVSEIPTEVAQEIISIAARAVNDPDYEIFSDENYARLRDVAARAGVVGGVFAGAGGGISNIRSFEGKITDAPTATSNPQDRTPVQQSFTGEGFEEQAGPVKPRTVIEEAAFTLEQENINQGRFDFESQDVTTPPKDSPGQTSFNFDQAPSTQRSVPSTQREASALNQPPTNIEPSTEPSGAIFYGKAGVTYEADATGVPIIQNKGTLYGSESAAKVRRRKLAKQYPDSVITVEPVMVDGKEHYVIKEDRPGPAQGSDVDDSVQVRKRVKKIFKDGRTDQSNRIELIPPEGSTGTRANAVEISKLGAEISEGQSENFAQRFKENFISGLAYLTERGYKLKNPLTDDTDVGFGFKFGKLGKVGEYIAKLSNEYTNLDEAVRQGFITPAKRNERSTFIRHKLKELGIDVNEQEFDNEVAQGEGLNTQSKEERTRESDKDQALRSAKDVAPGKGKQNADISEYKEGQVRVLSSSLDNKMGNIVRDLLQHIGVDTNVTIVDEDGAQAYIKDLEAKGKRNVSLDFEILLNNKLEKGGRGFIVYNDLYTKASDRTPVIFISNKNTKTREQLIVLAHEVGHLVQRSALETAPANIKKFIREAYDAEGRTEILDEWFANQMVKWAISRETPSNYIDRFFKKLTNKLRRMWQFLLRKGKASGLNTTFAEFMDALVGVRMLQEGGTYKPKTKLGREMVNSLQDQVRSPFLPKVAYTNSSADFTPEQFGKFVTTAKGKVFNKVNATKKGEMLISVGTSVIDNVLRPLHQMFTQSNDAHLRNMVDHSDPSKLSKTATWIADQFHHRPGNDRTNTTIQMEVNKVSGPHIKKLDDLIAKMPRKYNKLFDAAFGTKQGRLDKESAEYKELADLLISEKYSAAQLRSMGKEVAAEVREYLDDVHSTLTKLGLPIRKVLNYFPRVFDVGKILDNVEKFKEIIKKELKLSEKDADKIVNHIRRSNGVVLDLSEIHAENSIAGPAFSSLSHRKLSKQTAATLNEFYVDDVAAVLNYYTHNGIRRAVVQKRFNPRNLKTDSVGNITKDGMIDPMLELKNKLKEAVNGGELTPEQQTHIEEKILPAYFGRLGSEANPAWRSMSAAAVTYQNIRLLGFVVLSSIVDTGLISTRASSNLGLNLDTAGDLFKGPSAILKALRDQHFNKAKSEELYSFAKMIGAIRDDITEHIMTDSVTQQFMSPKFQKMNEYFFRLVRMHQWTNLTRVAALRVGREFIVDHAKKSRAGNDKSKGYLKELNITEQEVMAWDAAGQPADSQNHGKVIDALNQFIDEAVVRPSATQRPPWASDARYIMFTHLKSFFWGYQETVLRRVWAQTKGAPSMSAATLPFIFLAMSTLYLSSMGYELRQWISNGGRPPAHKQKYGADYFWEVVQRSGMLGTMQLMADVDQAEDFGRFSLLALAGPTVSHLEEFVTKDFDYFLSRSAPVFAQSSALRDWVRNDLF